MAEVALRQTEHASLGSVTPLRSSAYPPSDAVHIVSGRLAAGARLVDVRLPIGEEAPEPSREVRTASSEVGPFAWIDTEVEQQQVARVHQQLPLSDPYGALLAIGTIPAPEQAAFEERGLSAENGEDVDSIRTIARRSARPGGSEDRRRDIHRDGHLSGDLPGGQLPWPAQNQRHPDAAFP